MTASASATELKVDESKASETVHVYSLDYDSCMAYFAAAFLNPTWLENREEWLKAFKENSYVMQQIMQSIKEGAQVELLNGSNRQDLHIDFENRKNPVIEGLLKIEKLKERRLAGEKVDDEIAKITDNLADYGSVFAFWDAFTKSLKKEIFAESEEKISFDPFSLADFQSSLKGLKEGDTVKHALSTHVVLPGDSDKIRVTYKYPYSEEPITINADISDIPYLLEKQKTKVFETLSIENSTARMYHQRDAHCLSKLYEHYADDKTIPKWEFDDTKITLLFAQMHHLADKHRGKQIVLHFMDDRKDIYDTLIQFFGSNPQFMPDNVTLKLSQYMPYGPDAKREEDRYDFRNTAHLGWRPAATSSSIQGTGKFDPDYQKHTTMLFDSIHRNAAINARFGERQSAERTAAVAADFGATLKLPKVETLRMFKHSPAASPTPASPPAASHTPTKLDGPQ